MEADRQGSRDLPNSLRIHVPHFPCPTLLIAVCLLAAQTNIPPGPRSCGSYSSRNFSTALRTQKYVCIGYRGYYSHPPSAGSHPIPGLSSCGLEGGPSGILFGSVGDPLPKPGSNDNSRHAEDLRLAEGWQYRLFVVFVHNDPSRWGRVDPGVVSFQMRPYARNPLFRPPIPPQNTHKSVTSVESTCRERTQSIHRARRSWDGVRQHRRV